MLNTMDTSFDSCIKCTVCTTRCPVAEVNPDYPGPKQAGPDGERLRIKNPALYDEALQHCTNCKRCEVACPSGVHVGTVIQLAKARHGGFKKGPREFILSHTDMMGSLSTPAAPVVNIATQLKPVKKLLDKVLGIDQRQTLPKYTHQTFRRWFQQQKAQQNRFNRKISFFHGCFTNYNDPTVGKHLVAVLNAMNIGVTLLKKEKCCGVPLIANGFFDKARKNAELNMGQFADSLADSECVLATEPSCAMTLRDEYPEVLHVDNHALRERILFASAFITREFAKGNTPDMKPVNLRVAYHSPCHLIKQGGVIHTMELLNSIPGLAVIMLDQKCCGMSGTYGFKKENYQTSQNIGQGVFDQIEALNVDYVVTDCESCKMQIEMNTAHKVMHPLTLMAQSLA
ncbi:anaerobic glycerol-3-phosphate dehydrogenase subunit GlpC [Endozoicomonas sp. GU-1]|uniref:anaerobic glycerol-3-phosphate dehydrogenase subunit GlpC n=1 Tax=Endozoicomonas sp. GU-1 TaxID=3009078 RepID=UPI0022B36DAB|nr:anaerobic glycerol-3-phosphate dehydrogenase subunit GlpC [Endozoicomonas sp. GU-1]WBA81248.1 anaerobic glycerol-3-phosphate dehydrogenase subunit GlpC [Endozoicomonas sp. GU-1]WBA84194.1 anaerobic glycerol-3-phosphate dehydrogenase subunit GlpC [Endozoicomonas sp. GU-1]